MQELNELERAVLKKLLEGDHPVLERLRGQLAKCQVVRREMTGVGFLADLDVGEIPEPQGIRFQLSDVAGAIPGMRHGAGFVLFVENGRLSLLEGFGYDDPWPQTITRFTLEYDNGRGRNWKALWEKLKR